MPQTLKRPREETPKMPKIRVGGVPEHFNYPWEMGIERCIFEKHGVEVEWHVIKEGTGAMISALKEGKVDVIVALTEGLISDIAKGSDLRLIGCYVESPLCWAVSVGADSRYKDVVDLEGETIAISRFTSGSHLMANVMAAERGWDTSQMKFKVTGNFTNLRNAVNDPANPSAAFMWETFTTKPFHDSGEIRRVGDVTTPWPCFMMCTRESFAEANTEALQRMSKGIQEACKSFHSATDIMPLQIAKRFWLQKADAAKWYEGVRITASNAISASAITSALGALRKTKVIPPASEDGDDLSRFICPQLASLKADIKSMRLYDKHLHISWMHKDLVANGLASGNVSFRQLSPHDIKTYNGAAAIQQCIDITKLNRDSHVITIGSGLGGCARYIAGQTGASVLAVELQRDLHNTAIELTARCEERVQARVHHVGGDMLQVAKHFARGTYDVITSWLTILHISDRDRLFKMCFKLLKEGGCLYLEDFIKINEFSAREWKFINEDCHCKLCPTANEYTAQLEKAGFTIEIQEDMTGDWTQYSGQRARAFKEDNAEHGKLHGPDICASLGAFYDGVASTFTGGNLGGLRVVARKPITTTQ